MRCDPAPDWPGERKRATPASARSRFCLGLVIWHQTMAGSKTRFGFFGNGEEPPDAGESGAARTVIGHDIHLQKLPSGFARPSAQPSLTPLPPTPVPRTPLPRAPILAPMPEVVTEPVAVRRPYRPRKSRFARFLGRWTTGGNFRPGSRMGNSAILDDPGADDLELPRNTTGRNVLLVLVIAALTFAITFAVVKIRQRYTTPASGAQMVEPRLEPAPLPPMPVPSTVPAASPATPAPAGKPALLGTPTPPAVAPAVSPSYPRAHAPLPSPRHAATARLPATIPGASGSPLPRRRARIETPAAEPPEHLKGELLPLAP